MKLKDLISEYGDYEVSDELIAQFKKPKPKTVWDLVKGDDAYYYIDGEDAVLSTWYDWECDRKRLNIGNVFLTREEAEKDVERRKVETLLLKHGGRRWFDEHNFNYHIGLDDLEEHLKVYILVTVTQGAIYFDSKDNARKAIDEIGEERIKKALFEVR